MIYKLKGIGSCLLDLVAALWNSIKGYESKPLYKQIQLARKRERALKCEQSFLLIKNAIDSCNDLGTLAKLDEQADDFYLSEKGIDPILLSKYYRELCMSVVSAGMRIKYSVKVLT